MRVEFSPEAKREFDDGERYYERQVPGLGLRFRVDLQSAVRRLRTWPLAAPVERGAIRRMMLSRFTYKLLYSVDADRIYVIAVAHLHRAPEYWIGGGPTV
jgi:plasmid stabilization system protein ParE